MASVGVAAGAGAVSPAFGGSEGSKALPLKLASLAALVQATALT